MDFGKEHRAQFVGEVLLIGRIRTRLQPFDNARQARIPLLPCFETFTDEHENGPACARVDPVGNTLDLRGDIGRQRNAQARRITSQPASCGPGSGTGRCSVAHGPSMAHCAAQ
ncbi:MAG TPA: hypothetical protein VN620_06410 [Candidatus Methylomirabilis sp.]|nr:hypothetical protein [Candidatus Methylomirabilis sp.]